MLLLLLLRLLLQLHHRPIELLYIKWWMQATAGMRHMPQRKCCKAQLVRFLLLLL